MGPCRDQQNGSTVNLQHSAPWTGAAPSSQRVAVSSPASCERTAHSPWSKVWNVYWDSSLLVDPQKASGCVLPLTGLALLNWWGFSVSDWSYHRIWPGQRNESARALEACAVCVPEISISRKLQKGNLFGCALSKQWSACSLSCFINKYFIPILSLV